MGTASSGGFNAVYSIRETLREVRRRASSNLQSELRICMRQEGSASKEPGSLTTASVSAGADDYLLELWSDSLARFCPGRPDVAAVRKALLAMLHNQPGCSKLQNLLAHPPKETDVLWIIAKAGVKHASCHVPRAAASTSSCHSGEKLMDRARRATHRPNKKGARVENFRAALVRRFPYVLPDNETGPCPRGCEDAEIRYAYPVGSLNKYVAMERAVSRVMKCSDCGEEWFEEE